MGNDGGEIEQVLQYSCDAKLHGSMCKELARLVDRIEQVFPTIESARPGCMSGIEALCATNNAVKKAKLLIQHCDESSKLYLAITGEAIQSRFGRVQKALDQSLSKLQTMVPQPLASQISNIVHDLRDAKFTRKSSEEEAGRLLLALLRQDESTTDSEGNSESKMFHIAAVKLGITSSKAVLIEKRCIKRLIDKVHHNDLRKENILKLLLSLLRKYGRFGWPEQVENVDNELKGSLTSTKSTCNNSIDGTHTEIMERRSNEDHASSEVQMKTSGLATPPEEFICPMSLKLMSDPVVIASGKTYERIWIEKWFNEGHTKCPKTLKELPHLSLTPNSCVKDLISKWCKEHDVTIPDPCSEPIPQALSSCNMSDTSSILSFSSSLNGMSTLLDSRIADFITESDTSNVSINSDAHNSSHCLHLKTSEKVKCSDNRMLWWTDIYDSDSCQSFADFSYDMYFNFLSKLAMRPKESQCKVLKEFKIFLKDNDDTDYMHSNGFLEALMSFLLDARDHSNIDAQRTGLQILSAFVSNSRGEITVQEAVFDILASFIDSELYEDALEIFHLLSRKKSCRQKILASVALPSIIRLLDSPDKGRVMKALEILHIMSSEGDIECFILQSGCISKLVHLLCDERFSGTCLHSLWNLCESEHCRVAMGETNGCITAIAELLENGTSDDQGYAAALLLSLCSYSRDYCLSIMNEGVIPSLVYISNNGNFVGKESAMKLLHLLREITDDEPPDSLTQAVSDSKVSREPPRRSKGKGLAYAFLRKKLSIFSKHRSVALV